jgi:3'(2'), 5'-bisphosphate nucleotidase
MASPTLVNIGHLLSASLSCARRASQIIRDVRASGMVVTQKGIDDPVTQADMQTQRVILEDLLARWPSLTVIGEEDTPHIVPLARAPAFEAAIADDAVPVELRSVPIEDVCVFVDPLDATKEYTEGLKECVMTLIGIGVCGEPVAGVMHQPFVGEAPGRSVWALRGAGVYGLTSVSKRAEGLTVTVTRSHPTAELESALQALHPAQIIRAGGCGFKVLKVLEAEADLYLYPSPGTKKWDTCAPEAILRELGGVLVDKHGQRYRYDRAAPTANEQGILAARLDAVLQQALRAVHMQ